MSLNDSVYTIITNVIQTTKRENNKVIKKVDDLRDNFNVKKQSKDLYNNLKTTKKNIEPILKPDFDINLLKKSSITFKSFNLKMKISKNVFYIVTKANIYIYSKDL